MALRNQPSASELRLSPVALAQQVLELGIGRLTVGILGGLRVKSLEVPAGVAVPLQLQGQVGTLALELGIARSGPEGLFVDQVDLRAPAALRGPLVDDPGVPRPGGTVLAIDTQVLAQRFGGLTKVLVGLGAAGAVQQCRRVPPDLIGVDEVITRHRARPARPLDRREKPG